MHVYHMPTLFAAEAQHNFLHLGERFRSENAMLGPLSVGVAAVLAVVAVTVCWLVARARSDNSGTSINHPWKLLRELVQAHSLSTAQERLLNRMIRHYAIEPPARLFLEPERFQTALADAEFDRDRPELQGLKERLFAGATL